MVLKNVVRFYGAVTGEEIDDISQIPNNVREFLLDVPPTAIVQPFVIRDLRRGVSVGLISKRYHISVRKVHTIQKMVR